MSAPWLSRSDWAERTVRHKNVARWKALIFGCVIAGLGTAPIWGALERPHEFENTAARVFAGLFGGLIAAGGLWIVGSQLFDLFIGRGRDMGECRLRTLPGAVGGWFAAEVTIPDVAFAGPLTITLTSIRRTRVGNEIRFDVHWSDQLEAEPRSLQLLPAGGRVANVRFRIPEGVPVTSLDDDDNRVLWQLAVKGSVPGSDFEPRRRLQEKPMPAIRSLICATAFFVGSVASACPGDCGGDRRVSVNELVALVNVALGTVALDACEAGDVDANGELTVAELVRAVGAALDGCPPEAVILSAFFGLDDALPPIIDVVCPGGAGTDGMPVVFSDEIVNASLQADDFVVITASGAEKVPQCATLLPAVEDNENRTVLLVGDLGDAMGDPARAVMVSGSLRGETAGELRGLAFDAVTPLDAGPFLVRAEVMQGEERELDRPGNGGGCPADRTLQVVKVTWAGGVRSLSGEELGDAERMRYRVTFADGTEVAPFALADLNDNDNNHDLCLDDERTPIRVGMHEDTVVDPNGDPNPQVFVPVSPAR